MWEDYFPAIVQSIDGMYQPQGKSFIMLLCVIVTWTCTMPSESLFPLMLAEMVLVIDSDELMPSSSFFMMQVLMTPLWQWPLCTLAYALSVVRHTFHSWASSTLLYAMQFIAIAVLLQDTSCTRRLAPCLYDLGPMFVLALIWYQERLAGIVEKICFTLLAACAIQWATWIAFERQHAPLLVISAISLPALASILWVLFQLIVTQQPEKQQQSTTLHSKYVPFQLKRTLFWFSVAMGVARQSSGVVAIYVRLLQAK